MPAPTETPTQWATRYKKDNPGHNYNQAIIGEPQTYVALRKGQPLNQELAAIKTAYDKMLPSLPPEEKKRLFAAKSARGYEGSREDVRRLLERLDDLSEEAVRMQAHLHPVVRSEHDKITLRQQIIDGLKIGTLDSSAKSLKKDGARGGASLN